MTTKRVVTFGRQPTTKPKGMFREIHFPELALLDTPTNEGMISRVLTSEGANSRTLPRTIYFQKTNQPGHLDSVAAGALHEVTFDGETGKASGKGWLIDAPEGHEAAVFVEAQALFHNSVDLGEVKTHFEEEGDFWDDDFHVTIFFDEFATAATTLVGKPAFADSHSVMTDEVKAAFLADTTPVVVTCPSVYRVDVVASDEEIAARATGLPKWEHFFQPEAAVPHKIKFGEPDENGYIPVCGNLSLWESCLGGEEARCIRTPRPTDGYASFNKPGVLTDRGEVECGPIALFGGHISLDKAADDPANAWADVRVVAGVHGPWLSGIVRPGLPDDKLYTARASRLSGHWKGGRLRMITSVNAEGFDVPGSGFSFTTHEGEIDELVASFPSCSLPKEALTMEPLTPAAQKKIVEYVQAQGGGGSGSVSVGNINIAGGGGGGATVPWVLTGTDSITKGGITYTTIATDENGKATLYIPPTLAYVPIGVDEPAEDAVDLSIEIAKRQRLAALEDDE